MRNSVEHLPVNPYTVALKNGWQVFTYSEFAAIVKKSLSYLMMNYDERGFVFFSKKKHTFIICYNPLFPEEEVRWTLFHEMGHISLNHISADTPLMCRTGTDKPLLELEAEAFARGVLCPRFLLHDCEIADTAELMEFSGIPKREAEVLSVYLDKNSITYTANPLEVEVERQFAAFINDYKKNESDVPYFNNK